MNKPSDAYRKSVRDSAKCAVLRVPGFVLFTAIVFIAQLFWVGLVPAGESTGKDLQIFGQEKPKTQPVSGVESASSRTKEAVNGQFEKEVYCLALNIYFEARSEPEMGQRAVGHVVMNRVAHSGYPSSVCEVVQQGGEQQLHRCQFSWWCDGRSDKPENKKVWARSLRLARMIYLGILEDTTEGALWYHATYVTPYWSKILLRGERIGQHIFYLENRLSKNTL